MSAEVNYLMKVPNLHYFHVLTLLMENSNLWSLVIIVQVPQLQFL